MRDLNLSPLLKRGKRCHPDPAKGGGRISREAAFDAAYAGLLPPST